MPIVYMLVKTVGAVSFLWLTADLGESSLGPRERGISNGSMWRSSPGLSGGQSGVNLDPPVHIRSPVVQIKKDSHDASFQRSTMAVQPMGLLLRVAYQT